MKKKMISLLLILALCLGMTISVSAGDTGGFANEYCRVQDQAELMTYSEEAELNDMLDELSVRQKGSCCGDNEYAGWKNSRRICRRYI